MTREQHEELQAWLDGGEAALEQLDLDRANRDLSLAAVTELHLTFEV